MMRTSICERQLCCACRTDCALALASPLSGSYYMENAGRKEQMKVKMVTADDDMTTDIIVEGDVEEIERMRRDLNLVEKGMVYVKGVLEK